VAGDKLNNAVKYQTIRRLVDWVLPCRAVLCCVVSVTAVNMSALSGLCLGTGPTGSLNDWRAWCEPAVNFRWALRSIDIHAAYRDGGYIYVPATATYVDKDSIRRLKDNSIADAEGILYKRSEHLGVRIATQVYERNGKRLYRNTDHVNLRFSAHNIRPEWRYFWADIHMRRI